MTLNEHLEQTEKPKDDRSRSDKFWDYVNEFDYSIISDLYFRTKRFERAGSGKLYKALGVRKFQKAWTSVVEGFVGKMDHEAVKEGYVKSYDYSELKRYINFSKAAELIHAGSAVLLLPGTLAQFSNGKYVQGTALAALNVFGNLYPIMLQRFNRARIENYLESMEERK